MARKNKNSKGGAALKNSTNASRPGNGGAGSSSSSSNNNKGKNNNQRTGTVSPTSVLAPLAALTLNTSNIRGSNSSSSSKSSQHGGNKPGAPSSPSNATSPTSTSASASAPASSQPPLTPAEAALADRNLAILQGEFTTLDETLIISIHLDAPLSLSRSREILSHLSGVTILGEDDCLPVEDEFPPESTIIYTPTTSSEQSGTGSGGSSRSGDAEEGELDTSDLAKLKKMFPMVKEFTLVRALEKSPAGVDGAVDELLNRVFLDGMGEEEERAWKGVGRGVDGFGVEDDGDYAEGASLRRKKEKGKGRKVGAGVGVGGLWIDTQRRMSFQEAGNSYSPGGTEAGGSRWEAIQRDISFLSAAMHIPQQTVASACHAAGGDIAETVYRLVDRLPPPPACGYGGMMLDTEEGGGSQEKEVLELLSAAFPDVERRVGKGLWRLVVGREWAKGVVSPLASPVGQFPRVGGGWSQTGGRCHAHPPRPSAPLAPLEDGESSLGALFTIAAILQNSPRSQTSTCTSPSTAPRTPLLSPKSPTTTTATATYASRARPPPSTPPQTITINSRANTTSTFFSTPANSHTHTLTSLTSSLHHAHSMQSAYFRRASARNNLSSAAAYYSQHAQDLGKQLRDMQVERVLESVKYGPQGAEVDLHGLKVAEGVRVAREVVEGFFDGRGARERGCVRVITGKGRHSKDGKGVMGPGVVKMLRGEGWRVQVGSGWVEVSGRERG